MLGNPKCDIIENRFCLACFGASSVWARHLVIERASNHELNYQVQQQFTIGSQTLRSVDKYLFNNYTCDSLINSPIPTKQDWLRATHAARLAAEYTEPVSETTQRSILDFFAATGTNPW